MAIPQHDHARAGLSQNYDAPILSDGKIVGVTGVILAGGASSRMGSNKALLPHKGGRFIESIYRQLSGIFSEVILVTNSPEQYHFLPCRKVPDIFQEMGALAGIHAGLSASSNPAAFMVACDMPHLDPGLIRHIACSGMGFDLVLPRTPEGYEPLHALYRKWCLPAMEECLKNGRRRIVSILPQLRVREVTAEEVSKFNPTFDSFSNINTPEEYFRLRNIGRDEIQKPDHRGHRGTPRGHRENHTDGNVAET